MVQISGGLGELITQGMSGTVRILSDGAGQSNLFNPGLCWVHIERGLRKLSGHSRGQRRDIAEMQDLLWQYYQQLKQYKENPSKVFKAELGHRFDQIFGRSVIFFQVAERPTFESNRAGHGFCQNKTAHLYDTKRLPKSYTEMRYTEKPLESFAASRSRPVFSLFHPHSLPFL